MARVWRCGRFSLDLSRPLVMGIVNVTPDSFSDGGRYADAERAIAHGLELVAQGAHILDVGGESTRPGSDEVSAHEEVARVVPVIEGLVATFDEDPAVPAVPISIDTRHPEVAAAALAAGASIINDISGFEDPAMVDLAAQTDCGVIAMHMLGEPKTMQQAPEYGDVAREVADYLAARAMELEWRGVARERICLDPGFGFGKTLDHNVELFVRSGEIAALGYPVLIGVSRKSMVAGLTGITAPLDRDPASAELAAASVGHGGAVLRVHNVEATVAELERVWGVPAPDRDGRSSAPTVAYIALGSNLEGERGRKGNLRAAVEAISRFPKTLVTGIAAVVESEAAYLENQPPYANTVVRVETQLGLVALFAEIRGTELALGRVRGESNGPRTIDIDLLTFGSLTNGTAELTVPHPRLAERAFVVQPLLELDPEFSLPDGTAVTREAATVGPVTGGLGRIPAVLTPRVD